MAIHPKKREPLGDVLKRARQAHKGYWNFAIQGLPDPEVAF